MVPFAEAQRRWTQKLNHNGIQAPNIDQIHHDNDDGDGDGDDDHDDDDDDDEYDDNDGGMWF